ncbi:conserved hypothetical protein [Ricinus communis]|uniref:Uncharacterized protein n=1 Tax=Ricinus communis TaxID=3988 RepID=B9SXH8_RICCO|nr:conserved hypothetical protein [Ricinus communis]
MEGGLGAQLYLKWRSQVVFLSETKQQRRFLDKVKRRLGFGDGWYVEPHGISGGLALWWHNSVSVKMSPLRPGIQGEPLYLDQSSGWE